MSKENKNTKFIAFHVDEELKEILYKKAKEDGRPFSSYMRNHLNKTFGDLRKNGK